MNLNLWTVFLFLGFFIVCLFQPAPANADHFTGTEITYAYSGTPGVYVIRFRFYRDCGGIDSPGPTLSMQLQANNSCGTSANQTITLIQSQNIEVSEVCPGQATECTTPPDNSVNGVELREYTGLLILPPTPNGCSDWILVFSGSARNFGIVNLNNGNSGSFYTSALLNNENFIENSSPVFSSSPVPYVCLNDTVEYNPQVTDPDGDSLVYSLAPALSAGGNLINYTPNYTFDQPFGNTTVTPLPTVLNPYTGQLTFKPTVAGGFVVVFNVEEWRRINGVPVLVGSVQRDVQVQVVQCISPPPRINNLTLVTDGVPGTPYLFSEVKELQACVPYCIEIPAKTNAGASIVLNMTSNAANEIPGSVFTVTDQNTQNPKGVLCFTPSPELAGQTVSFTVAVVDNACPIPNDIIKAIQVKIKKSTGFRTVCSADTICAGQSVQLSTVALTGTVPLTSPQYQGFTWKAYNAAGQPVAGNFQNNDSSAVTATVFPSQTARYVLSSPTIFGCTDTASVFIFVKGIQPAIQTLALPGAVQCDNVVSTVLTEITAHTNSPSAQWNFAWSPALGLSDTSVASPQVSFAGQNQVTYQLVVSNGACSDTGTVAVQFAPGIQVAASASPGPFCVGETVQLTTNITGPGATGSSVVWVAGSRIQSPADAQTFAKPDSVGENLYVAQVITAAGCVVTDSVMVLVNGVLPVIGSVSSSASMLCAGQQAQLHTIISYDQGAINPVFTYSWNPAEGLNNTSIPDPIVMAGQSSGTQLFTVVVSNGACSDTDTVSLRILENLQVVAASSPGAVCLPGTINLSASVINGTSSGLDYQWYGPGITDATQAQTNAVVVSPDQREFVVEVSLNGGCQNRDTILVDIEAPLDPQMALSFSPDSLAAPPVDILFQNLTGVILPEESISWQIVNLQKPANSAIQLTDNQHSHTFNENGQYQVTLTVVSPLGCPYSINRTFEIIGFKVPNVITPNGDGLNDVFRIQGLRPGGRVTVFTRWGKETGSFGYQGTWTPAADLPAGVYFYLIQNPGEAPQKGWLEVLK